MFKRYEQRAVAVCVLAIIVALAIVILFSTVAPERWAWSNLAPNAWGDFYAGLFAPSAFLMVCVGFWANAKVTAQHSKMLEVQTETTHAGFLLSVHKEFVDLMSDRILVWREFADPASRVTESSQTYTEFWLIVAFFQRLALLIERKAISSQEAAAIMGQNAWWWYVYFFNHPRCEQCGDAELNPAKKAWELIKSEATKDQLAEWSESAMGYGNPAPLPRRTRRSTLGRHGLRTISARTR